MELKLYKKTSIFFSNAYWSIKGGNDMRAEISFKPLSKKRRGWYEATVAKSRKHLESGCTLWVFTILFSSFVYL